MDDWTFTLVVSALAAVAVLAVGGIVGWYLLFGYWHRRYRQAIAALREDPQSRMLREAALWTGRNAGLGEQQMANDIAAAAGFPADVK